MKDQTNRPTTRYNVNGNKASNGKPNSQRWEQPRTNRNK